MQKNVFFFFFFSSKDRNAIVEASPSPFCELNTLPLVFTVVLPPEKAEGCENHLHSEDVEQDVVREAAKAAGKKRISLNV